MNPTQELMKRISGREYRNEMSKQDEDFAREHGLIVIFGASDDLTELRGAINDEIGCYGGGEFVIDHEGIREPWRDDEEKCRDEAWEYFRRESFPHMKVKAEWCDKGGPCWRYTAEPNWSSACITVGHFMIYEDGEKYCKGIIIEIPPGPHE